MCNLKQGTNEPISETERDSQRTDSRSPRGGGRGSDGVGFGGWQMQTVKFRTDEQQGPTVEHRKLFNILW